jgi:hypothetical protein
MTVQFWCAAFSIALSLNAAHGTAYPAERPGAYAAEYCGETRGLREVAQDETKTFSELCQRQRSNADYDQFNPSVPVVHLEESADSGLIRSMRSRSQQRGETDRYSDWEAATSTSTFSISRRVDH